MPLDKSEPEKAALTDAAKEEIAEAVRIVAADKSYRNTQAIRDHLIPRTPENDPPGDGEPTPPPKKDGDNDGQPEGGEPVKKKTGIWWGDRLDA